jgi:Zn-dependent peptidase ImmA (M78 family)
MGGCALINTNPTMGMQLFSLAHEYAHFIFHKEQLGIISSKEEEHTLDERLANYFASNFLMPEEAINDIFNIRIKNRKDAEAEDIIYISDYFGVSFKAMVYRLNSLKLISNEKRDQLIAETWVTAVRKSMGISEPERGRFKFPPLYFHLCMKAYQQGKISTAKLADFLELPLYQAMELGRKIKGSIQNDNQDNI